MCVCARVIDDFLGEEWGKSRILAKGGGSRSLFSTFIILFAFTFGMARLTSLFVSLFFFSLMVCDKKDP